MDKAIQYCKLQSVRLNMPNLLVKEFIHLPKLQAKLGKWQEDLAGSEDPKASCINITACARL